jgi:hypothetical protein
MLVVGHHMVPLYFAYYQRVFLFHICLVGSYVAPPALVALWQLEPKFGEATVELGGFVVGGGVVLAAPFVWNHQPPGFCDVPGVPE